MTPPTLAAMPDAQASNGITRVAVLGATGSIGESTLDLISRHPQRFRAEVLTGHSQVQKMLELALRFQPKQVVMVDLQAAKTLREALSGAGLSPSVEVLDGADSLREVSQQPDIDLVVAGIVGSAGLGATLAAASAGKRILLANKEALVMAGALMVNAAKRGGATILPIDSEHNAIFQCLGPNYRCFERPPGVTRILLTASGGPFRRWSHADIDQATVAQAIAHPNWTMGRKISVDSATMMNKGLELIEAYWLFAMPERDIDVVVHPQSVIHSMVEYTDGSTLAQLGCPDMRTPIASAMAWPLRMETPVARLDWRTLGQLDFEPPDDERFPSLRMARQSLQQGGTASAVMNAANEVAVEAFLGERIRFGDVFRVVSETLNRCPAVRSVVPESLDALLAIDQEARRFASNLLKTLKTFSA
jgi:1-deoxy-D-xylulose-5-phosphate reductoisomerase